MHCGVLTGVKVINARPFRPNGGAIRVTTLPVSCQWEMYPPRLTGVASLCAFIAMLGGRFDINLLQFIEVTIRDSSLVWGKYIFNNFLARIL